MAALDVLGVDDVVVEVFFANDDVEVEIVVNTEDDSIATSSCDSVDGTTEAHSLQIVFTFF